MNVKELALRYGPPACSLDNQKTCDDLLNYLGVPADAEWDQLVVPLGRQDCLHLCNPQVPEADGRIITVNEAVGEILDVLQNRLRKRFRARQVVYLGPTWMEGADEITYRVRPTDCVMKVGPRGLFR